MMKTILLMLTALILFCPQSGWSKSKKTKKLTIEYPITEMVKLCDKCGGRGKILNTDISSLEIGEANQKDMETCPECNGSGFIKEEGRGIVDYYKKTVAVMKKRRTIRRPVQHELRCDLSLFERGLFFLNEVNRR